MATGLRDLFYFAPQSMNFGVFPTGVQEPQLGDLSKTMEEGYEPELKGEEFPPEPSDYGPLQGPGGPIEGTDKMLEYDPRNLIYGG